MARIIKIAPGFRYYAVVDGTNALDSAKFCAHLDPRRGFGGWKNVIEFLPKDPAEPARLMDAAHPFLPIYRLDEDGKPAPEGSAVVCPGGLNGKGMDRMWQTYSGDEPRVWHLPPKGANLTETTYGRYTAAEESAEFMSQFILEPAIQVDANRKVTICSGREREPGASVFRAELLYVSSHGWQGGFMKGESPNEWLAARPAIEDDEIDPRRLRPLSHSYFLVGRADANGACFRGPLWIVLAQCSTLNPTTWPIWGRILARSNPPVRGILGYEQAAPAATSAVRVGADFFRELTRHRTFLDAWRAANPNRHWSAIIHKDAQKDRLLEFPSDPLPNCKVQDYVVHARSLVDAGGQAAPMALHDDPPPFAIRLSRIAELGGGRELSFAITPSCLDEPQSYFRKDALYEVRIESMDRFKKVELRWIHVRPTDRQFPHTTLFAETTVLHTDARLTVAGLDGVVAEVAHPVSNLVMRFKTPDARTLRAANLEPNHAYFWPRIAITTAQGRRLVCDFRAHGLLLVKVPQ